MMAAAKFVAGWVSAAGLGLLPLPRGWRPRRVYGYDPTGNRRETRVASTAAALWTGAASTFAIEASDNTLVDITVSGMIGEDTRATPT